MQKSAILDCWKSILMLEKVISEKSNSQHKRRFMKRRHFCGGEIVYLGN